MTPTLNLIALAISLTIPASGAATEISTFQPTPVKPIAAIAQLQPEPNKKLELAPFPYLPMGSRPNSYAPHNCTWGVASMKVSIPNNWGNAAQWADHARAEGHTVSLTPIVGSVAQHGGGAGHVGLVVGLDPVNHPDQIFLEEMNFDWHGGVRISWQPVGKYVYIWV